MPPQTQMNFTQPLDMQPKIDEVVSYEDVLKDLDQSNAVVYEDLKQPPPAEQATAQLQPLGLQPQMPNNPSNNYQIQQDIHQRMNEREEPQEHYQANQTEQSYQTDQSYQNFRNEHYRNEEMSKKEDEQFEFLNKHNLNDMLYVIVASVLVNTKQSTELFMNHFPSLFENNEITMFGVIFKSFVLVFVWILIKKVIAQYINK